MDNQIAVIILNYFGFKDTIKCINSVQISLNSVIFLVDNTADQNERIKFQRVFQNKNDIHMFFPSKNLGFAAGVNFAIGEAVKKGFRRFLLLNNDTILLNGAEAQLNKAFNQYPTALMAPIIKWGERINKGNYYNRFFGLIVNDRAPNSGNWLYYFTGCALAFDKTFLEKVGYFNEKFFMYGEDIELTFRAKKEGIPLILIQDELVYHSGSKSAKMASFFYEYHMTRSHYLLCFFLFSHPLKKAIAVFIKTFTLTLRACVRSHRYHNLNPLKALLIAPVPLKIRPKQRK